MAGFYPDVPGPRMAYHKDGTVVTYKGQAVLGPGTAFTPAELASRNSESPANTPSGMICFIFPEKRDITGFLATRRGGNISSSGNDGPLEWSPDTTNGSDGQWFAATDSTAGRIAVYNVVAMRTGIAPLSLTGVKGLRFMGSATGSATATTPGVTVNHLYGRISNMQLDRRLRLWHPTENQPLEGHYFDWGDVARGSTATRGFRVKNHSTIWTATDVNVGIEHPTDANPTLGPQSLLSTGSSPAKEGQKAIGTLLPEEVSEVITLHRDTSPTAQLSLWWSLITAEPSHWDE